MKSNLKPGNKHPLVLVSFDLIYYVCMHVLLTKTMHTLHKNIQK